MSASPFEPLPGVRTSSRGRLFGGLLAVIFLGGLAWFIYDSISHAPASRKPSVQQVAVLRQPPPTPPKTPEKLPDAPMMKD
jgi:hypothetical protein